jgi:von Willebrand factor type A domain/Tubulin like
MSGKSVGRGQYLKGLLVLLLSPLLALAALYAYVCARNMAPQPGALRTSVRPQAVFPWDSEATYLITFDGAAPEQPSATPPPIDIAFLIDVSGSMTSSLPAMAQAAHRVTTDLAAGNPGFIRFSLVRFDTESEITTDWTADPEELYAGLKGLRQFTGGNDSRRAFEDLNRLLGRARPQAKKVVVFYTDGGLDLCTGCPREPMSKEEMTAEARRLRDEGVEIYSVGLPGADTEGLMVEITGSPTQVFDPISADDLVANFRSVAAGAVGAAGGGAQLSHRLDGRHFAAPLEGTEWTVDRAGSLNRTVGQLPTAQTTFAHPLVPLSSGVWRVGVEPPRLTFAGEDGRLRRLDARHRPLMLVVGWAPLLLGLLPALGWSLYGLRRPPSVLEHEAFVPLAPRPRPPTPLPAPPNVRDEREAPIPTLFVGLGGAGRAALHAVRAELKQAHLGREGQPYRFLWFDLDSTEAGSDTPFGEWSSYPVEELLAPADVYRLAPYVPRPGAVPEHLKWFDARRYDNAPGGNLNLSEGAKGDRMLARLALFRWLVEKPEPLVTLAERCAELSDFASSDGTRQVVVFASRDGGAGGGWFLDFGRLLRRITRRQQQNGEVEFVPELVGVLCDSPERGRPENRAALEMEITSSALSGAFPQRVAYAQGGDALLDRSDTESPYNWVFSTSGAVAAHVAVQCGEIGAVLAERHPRAALLKEADSLAPRRVVSVLTHAVHVLPTRLYEQVSCELFLRLVGPDILLDIEPSAGGGFAPRSVSDDAAAQNLSEWAKGERPGTTWQMLLAAAADEALLPGYLKAVRQSTADADSLRGALANSLSRRLRGRRDPDGAKWRRDWMPGDAVATLRLLGQRLAQRVRAQAHTAGGTATALDLIDHAARLADSAAADLEGWVKDFCRECEAVSRRLDDLSRRHEDTPGAFGRTYIDPPAGRKRVERLTQAIFETWLCTPDIVSAIRERLFFTFAQGSDHARVGVSAYIGEAREFGTAGEAAAALEGYMGSLARTVPAVRIGGALMGESVERREALARGLVESSTSQRAVLIVTPRPVGRDAAESQALEDFKARIPQPAHHGRRREQAGDDHSAVRRVELKEAAAELDVHPDRLNFVSLAEQGAEQVRRRAERKYGLFVPPLPAELRVALAHGDAFRSFARAYKVGGIVPRADSAGAMQWASSETAEFLTAGAHPSLAEAAANYTWYFKSAASDPAAAGGVGDFTKLHEWLRKRNFSPDEETLVQIAVDVCED